MSRLNRGDFCVGAGFLSRRVYACAMQFSQAVRTSLSLSLCLALNSALHAADSPRFPTTDDLRHIKAISGLALSPDGSQVIFAITDSTADGAKSHLWLVSTSGAADTLRQITFSPPSDKRGERGAQWSPDGKAIFFLARRGEHTQLFRLDLRGGEAQPYDLKVAPAIDDSKAKNFVPPPGADKKDDKDKKGEKKDDKKDELLPVDVGSYSISAGGKWLAVIARNPETPGEKKGRDDKADAEWVNRETHGSRLYLAGLKADGSLDGALKPVAIVPDVRSAAWSLSTGRLLVTAEPPNDLSDLGPAGKVFLVDASTPDKAQQLSMIPPTVGGVAFSPDESTIVFSATTKEDAPRVTTSSMPYRKQVPTRR